MQHVNALPWHLPISQTPPNFHVHGLASTRSEKQEKNTHKPDHGTRILLGKRQNGPLQKGGADLFWDVFFLFFGFCFPFFVRASKMLYFTAFSREIDAFYTSPSTSPASFSTSPASPTNILASPTNRGCSWRVDGVKKIMLQTGGQFNPS